MKLYTDPRLKYKDKQMKKGLNYYFKIFFSNYLLIESFLYYILWVSFFSFFFHCDGDNYILQWSQNETMIKLQFHSITLQLVESNKGL